MTSIYLSVYLWCHIECFLVIIAMRKPLWFFNMKYCNFESESLKLFDRYKYLLHIIHCTNLLNKFTPNVLKIKYIWSFWNTKYYHLPIGLGTGSTLQQSKGTFDNDQMMGWTRSWIFNEMATILQLSALTAIRLSTWRNKLINIYLHILKQLVYFIYN